MTRPSRTPRRPSIGFCSCSRRTASSSLRSLLGGLVAGQRDLDRQVGQVGQELVQRRVDQPDGDRQAVHRLEDLDEVAALQRLERVQRGLPLVVVLGQDQPLDQLAPLAEEHVLGAGQADALRRRTGGPGRESSPVSALARTPSRRRSSACVMIRCTALTSSSASGSQAALEVLHDRARRRPAPRRGRPRRRCRRWRSRRPR